MKETGWAWVGRLAGFVALFVACALGLGLVASLFTGPDAAASPTIAWWMVVPVLTASFAATWLLAVLVDGQRLSWLGLRGGIGGVTELVLGSFAGVVIVGVPVLILAALGWVSWTASAESSFWRGIEVSALVFGAALAEELLFRGYPFRVIQARFGPVAALVATSTAFGLAHGANPGIGPLAFLNLGLAGGLLGVVYWRTGSLWFVGGVHFGWNWLLAAFRPVRERAGRVNIRPRRGALGPAAVDGRGVRARGRPARHTGDRDRNRVAVADWRLDRRRRPIVREPGRRPARRPSRRGRRDSFGR